MGNIWEEVLEGKSRWLIEIRMLSCLEGRIRCNKMGYVPGRSAKQTDKCTETKEIRKVEKKM